MTLYKVKVEDRLIPNLAPEYNEGMLISRDEVQIVLDALLLAQAGARSERMASELQATRDRWREASGL